jgi:hypothetical protein
VVVVRPIVKSGPHADEKKAPVKTPVMKVVVMEAGEVREGVAGECRSGEDMRRKHMAAETMARKSVAAEARVAAEAAMPASAATTAMTAAMCNGAGRQQRRAERNGRSERNTRHLQPHESLTSLCRCCLFVGGSCHAAPRIVIVAST